MGELFGIPVVFLSAINGRPTRVVCFVSVGKQANPTPTLRRFPRKCVRIFVGARPQREGAERREIGQWLVNGLRVWWAFRRWWWGEPHPTGLYGHRRLHRGRYPLPSPPPLRTSPCRGGGSSVVVWHFGCFLLLGMNGRSTRVVCFSSVGKQANPAPTLRRFPRKCERIFVGAHPQGAGAERREIGQ